MLNAQIMMVGCDIRVKVPKRARKAGPNAPACAGAKRARRMPAGVRHTLV